MLSLYTEFNIFNDLLLYSNYTYLVQNLKNYIMYICIYIAVRRKKNKENKPPKHTKQQPKQKGELELCKYFLRSFFLCRAILYNQGVGSF